MSDGISFGSVGGDANVNTGEGKFAGRDIVEGDQNNPTQGGIVEHGEGSVNAEGQTYTFNDTPERPNAGFFDAIRSELGSIPEHATPPTYSLLDVPEIPKSILEPAIQRAPSLPTPIASDLQSFSSYSSNQLVDAWEAESELPEAEQDLGKVSAILHTARGFGPKIIYGVLAAGEAYLKSKIQTSSIVAAGIAFLGELRN